MKQFCNQTALFASWRRCAQAGLSPEAWLYPLGAEEVQLLCRSHQPEIAAFHHVMSGLQLPKDTASFLMDGHGLLLEKSADTELWKPFCPGFSFGEDCAGPNAVPRTDAA